MNKKAQMNGLGIIIAVAVTLIVGVVLFQVIAQEVGSSVNTVSLANVSMEGPAVDAVPQYISGVRLIGGTIKIFNATGDVEIPVDNYTIANNVVHPTTGELTISITPASPDPTTPLGHNAGTWTVDSSSAQETTYIADAGGRAMASLIVIFFALAIAVVAIIPSVRSEVLSMMGK